MQYPLRQIESLAVALCFLISLAAGQATNQLADTRDQQLGHAAPERQLSSTTEVTIPGPLRSFLRMAGISQKVSTDEVLPLFARNVYVQGYVGWQDRGSPTEFLVLLGRYVNQAKELAQLAGADGTIRVDNCEQALPLLRVLGYRLRQACGQANATLVTAEAERAFLTTDSGFPLPALERALRQAKPFSYQYPSTRVPLLFQESDWTAAMNKKARNPNEDVIATLLHHPMLARLYWAMSRIDRETRDSLEQSVGLKKLLPFAAHLDFYGSQISIRNGRVEVPGGSKAEPGWKDLVGAAPDSPSEYVTKLLAKDNGWLLAYFDSLARINQQQQEHFTESHRLKAFYAAFRGPDVSTDAARPAFRLAPGLLLLLTRVRWDDSGQPLVPGGLEVWKEILNQKTDSKLVREWGRRSNHWTHPDQLLEAMFAFSRLNADMSPLHTYLLFTELDSVRSPNHLKPETFRLLARNFDQFDEQYLIFSEFPELDDESITSFVTTADSVDHISNHTLRGNAMGTIQANVGLWQILARQRQIPESSLNASWQEVIKPFAKIASSAQLFDAGRSSLLTFWHAAGGQGNVSEASLIELIAGPQQKDAEGQRVHEEVAKGIRSVMDGQRLVALDTLLSLADGLNQVAKGEVPGRSLLPLAGELREFEMPRPIFSSSERTEWAAGIYNNRHTELQMQTDLAKVLKSSAPRAQLEESRGQLASFLRDTLVGLNYAYYEPPGAQLLHANPLFVRTHDFSGDTVVGVAGLWRAPQLFGEGSPAGGGAHFVGSLADLPYALSEAEQDFIAPENVQALIWREAVPGLLTDAILPRWWNVSRNELHAVTLYQRAGEEMVSSAAAHADLRAKVIAILSDRMSTQKICRLEDEMQSGQAEKTVAQLTPADSFYLTAEFRRRFPDDSAAWGPSGQELDRLAHDYPDDVSWERLSRDFGVPHHTLAQSYARELLNVKPFPAFAGYSSRLMAESWDSNNLYWARLADEMGYAPVMLNRLVPELTRRMVGKIFATDFEDWPALLRAMREAGEDFRQGKIALAPTTRAAVGTTH